MQHTIPDKLPNVGTSIFTEMSVLANKYNAINLGQGFPNWDMDSKLIDAVQAAMQAGYNQYTHSDGLPLLRNLLADKYNTLYGCAINATDNITVTPGGTYAIYTVLTTLLQAGDEVIVLEPAYDCYIPAIQLLGAVPVTVPLQHPTYHINWQLVEQHITTRTKLIIINSPHNPTGAVLGDSDITALHHLVATYGLYILSDEVYEHLIFNGHIHHSILRYPTLFAHSFITFSFGKTYSCTGIKLGYCIAPAAYTAAFKKIHQYNAFSCNTPIQVALSNYIQANTNYLQLGPMVQQQRDVFETLMLPTRFTALPSYGSYFQLYSYAAISELPEREFAVWLTVTHGVTVVPVSAFYQMPVNNKVVRFCFAKTTQTLQAAASKLLMV